MIIDNGILEINETLKGIIHLFGGSEKEKITAAFLLFDTDESGFIEFDEVLNFVLTTLKLVQHQGKGLREENEQQLRDLAYATTADVFKVNHLFYDIIHSSPLSLWILITVARFLLKNSLFGSKLLKEKLLKKTSKLPNYWKKINSEKSKKEKKWTIKLL